VLYCTSISRALQASLALNLRVDHHSTERLVPFLALHILIKTFKAGRKRTSSARVQELITTKKKSFALDGILRT
jgi:hypothetical protein